jgi:hypothetical protein
MVRPYPINMGAHMKTTVEISDELLARSRRLARREGTTLRALIEDGLRLALKARGDSPPRKPFQMVTVHGDGLTAEYQRKGLHQAIYDSYAGREASSLEPPAHDRD